MSYRWRPSRAARNAYAQKMREAEKLYTFVTSNGPIRRGCIVKFVGKADNIIYEGEVIRESYGALKGQHTFSVKTKNGLKLVKGRNLYDRLLNHEQGECSKEYAEYRLHTIIDS